MCMKFVHQATSNSIFIICYHIQQAEFKTGVGVSMSLCHCPGMLSHALACVYLIHSVCLSFFFSFPSSFPQRSCLTNSGQGQLS